MPPPPGFIQQQNLLPLPPLVPEHPPMLRPPQPERRPTASILTEDSEAERVMSMLGDLEEKMQFVGDKVDKIQFEEKKHYESLRRGLKRLKDDKPNGSTELNDSTEPNGKGDYPCCICNYCLKRIWSSFYTDFSQCGYLCHV